MGSEPICGKIKALTTEPGDHEPIVVEEFDSFDSIEFCAEFEYLGVVTAKTGNGDEAVFDRLNKARKAFWAQNSCLEATTDLGFD